MQSIEARQEKTMSQQSKKKADRCPRCGRFTRFIWNETDKDWYWQTGQVAGYYECDQCGYTISAG